MVARAAGQVSRRSDQPDRHRRLPARRQPTRADVPHRSLPRIRQGTSSSSRWASPSHAAVPRAGPVPRRSTPLEARTVRTARSDLASSPRRLLTVAPGEQRSRARRRVSAHSCCPVRVTVPRRVRCSVLPRGRDHALRRPRVRRRSSDRRAGRRAPGPHTRSRRPADSGPRRLRRDGLREALSRWAGRTPSSRRNGAGSRSSVVCISVYRGAGIRTRDLVLPKHARYQAAPRPV